MSAYHFIVRSVFIAVWLHKVKTDQKSRGLLKNQREGEGEGGRLGGGEIER